MANHDKIRELAEEIEYGLRPRVASSRSVPNVIATERIIRTKLKPLLEPPDMLKLAMVIRLAADKWQELEWRERPERGDYCEWVAKSVIEWLAAELQCWGKE